MSTNGFAEAEAPFNDSKADVILCSSDGVDFRTFKVLLSLASPAFESMFNLPQPSPELDSDEMEDDLAVVHMSETSSVIEMLLKLLHPKCSLRLDNLADVGELLEMSRKYDMDGVTKCIREKANAILLQVEEKDPFRAFAVACRFQLEDELRRAAKSTLKLSMLEISNRTEVDELKYITGIQLYSLYNYHLRCSQAATVAAHASTWIPRNGVVWFSAPSNHSKLCKQATNPFLINGIQYWPRAWWVGYMQGSRAALRNRPHSTTVNVKRFGLDKVLQNASACEFCRSHVFDEMPGFLEAYATEVERVVSAVELEVTF